MNTQQRQTADRAVIDRVKATATDGASAAQIATAFLGPRARRHKYRALESIGLGVAARLIGEGRLQATRSNRFTAVR